jgi:hypothetical protein
MSIRNFRDIREIGTRHIDLAKTRVQELMFHKRIVDSNGETQLAATANEWPMKVLTWIQVGLHSMNQSPLELVVQATKVRNLALRQFLDVTQIRQAIQTWQMRPLIKKSGLEARNLMPII